MPDAARRGSTSTCLSRRAANRAVPGGQAAPEILQPQDQRRGARGKNFPKRRRERAGRAGLPLSESAGAGCHATCVAAAWTLNVHAAARVEAAARAPRLDHATSQRARRPAPHTNSSQVPRAPAGPRRPEVLGPREAGGRRRGPLAGGDLFMSLIMRLMMRSPCHGGDSANRLRIGSGWKVAWSKDRHRPRVGLRPWAQPAARSPRAAGRAEASSGAALAGPSRLGELQRRRRRGRGGATAVDRGGFGDASERGRKGPRGKERGEAE